jgi:hypothetical protein
MFHIIFMMLSIDISNRIGIFNFHPLNNQQKNRKKEKSKHEEENVDPK